VRRQLPSEKFSVAIAAEQRCCNGQNQAGGALLSLFAAVEQQRYTASAIGENITIKLPVTAKR
jgi:hypothetical protein